MDQLTIQEVTADTFNDLLHLITELAEYEHLPPPSAEAQNRLRRDCLSDNPKYKAHIAKLSGKPVAYIVHFFTYSTFLAMPTLYIEDIFVLKEYRRMGIGRELFNFVKRIAKQDGCGRIEFTVLKWNKNAQEFYRKNGAKPLEWDIYRIEKEAF